MFVSLNPCKFRDLHVFLYGKIIVVSIPDHMLQSQIRKKICEMFVIVVCTRKFPDIRYA